MKNVGKRRTPEQIVRLLNKAEAQLEGGAIIEDVCRDPQIAVSTLLLTPMPEEVRWHGARDAKKLKVLSKGSF